jgi:hypothetical protein
MYITTSQREKLAQGLFDKMIELRQKGEGHIKKYEIAFQDVIERVFPEESWWNITGCNIFMHLMEHKDPEATVIEILKQLKED